MIVSPELFIYFIVEVQKESTKDNGVFVCKMLYALYLR